MNGENGYSLEVFNALGKTIAVLVLAESQIEPLFNNEMLHIRVLGDWLLLCDRSSSYLLGIG
jgi:hypothetical protein